MDQVLMETIGVDRPLDDGHRPLESLVEGGVARRHLDGGVAVRAVQSRASGLDAWYGALSLSQDHPHLVQRLVYVHLVKRALDLACALVLLVVLLPVLLAVTLTLALAERHHGPVLFRQTRIGQGGVPFTIYKFRTMRPDRRQRQETIPFPDRRQRHKTEADPRITRLGRFLRKTSLDELPQLLNVLKGDMSLVGPRPELPQLVAHYQPWQHQRHLVRPGITGWWQINGRSERPMHLNTELDLYYVEHTSFWLDLQILVRTAIIALLGKGAY